MKNSVEKAFSLILESNLSALKQDSERRFTLLIVGEPTLTASLAEALSANRAKPGIHPWISLHSLVHPEAIEHLHEIDVVLLVVEHSALTGEEVTFIRGLHRASVPTIVVIVDASARPADGGEVRSEPPRRFEAGRVVLAEAQDQELIQKRLVPALVSAAESNLRLAIARQFPIARAPIVDQLIEEAARANAIYAASSGVAEAIPILNLTLNAADLLILSKNQLLMSYKIALAAGKQGQTKELMGEVVGVVGSGFLFRQVARQLVGLIPIVGIVPKIAVAYAGTWVVGHTVYLWAAEDKNLDIEEARILYNSVLARGRTVALDIMKDIGKRRPKDSKDAPALPSPYNEQATVDGSVAQAASSPTPIDSTLNEPENAPEEPAS
ncbi:MAG: hypothetical protein JO316_18690 [Abitibacteriaceae bacterium]|nr:hypothetical protein [Abditibacteriaceae bacterium]MBV9867390.1 hypothetical protein [Abditibacteriaceae bacterium]